VGKLFVIPVAIAVMSATPLAQAPQAPQSRNVFRSSASLVALNVTVTHGDELVTGLHAADFEIYEDGVQQEVRFFEAKSVPMDVILLLDTSASMRDRMPVVHEAARSFMAVLREEDRGAVVAFNDNVRVLQDLTSDGAAIEQAINATTASGSTAMHNALYIALKQFGRTARQSGDVRRQAIAVLSDGEDTTSVIAFDDVVRLARRMGVNIYTIGLQSRVTRMRKATAPGYFSQSDYELRTLAKETGARAFFPANVHELKDVYADIAAELEAQYSIAYAPANGRADGQFRRILVRVTADPDYRPRARAGYTADASNSASQSPLR
jgi:Ca-activated chloride channel family protein